MTSPLLLLEWASGSPPPAKGGTAASQQSSPRVAARATPALEPSGWLVAITPVAAAAWPPQYRQPCRNTAGCSGVPSPPSGRTAPIPEPVAQGFHSPAAAFRAQKFPTASSWLSRLAPRSACRRTAVSSGGRSDGLPQWRGRHRRWTCLGRSAAQRF